MNDVVLDLLVSSMRDRGPMPLDELHRLARQAGSPWSEAQLSLFLRCASALGIRNSSEHPSLFGVEAASTAQSLGDVIVAIVRASGPKGLTVAEIRKRIPQTFITTEAQVLDLARKSPVLERTGPLFRSK